MADAPRPTTVRLARQRDLEAISGFGATVVHGVYDDQIGVDAAERMLGWWGPTLADAVDAGLVHVAVDGTEIVGLVERGTVDDEPVIWKLYVAADRRSHGLGRRLLAVAEADIDPSHSRVLLEHVSTNHRAARFYEREGFEIVRRDPSDEPENDIVWRARPLDPTRAVDDYATSAEFHEIHMDAPWRALGELLADTFGDLPADATVVDLGAGSGAGTVELARRSVCQIVAVERSSSMRSMLLVRLAEAGLLDRVTVLPGSIPTIFDELDQPVAGVVAGHMLGHLTADHRRATFEWAAAHLTPSGQLLATVSGPTPPDPDTVLVEERRVGRHVHRAHHHRPDADHYESMFEVVDDGRTVRACVVTGTWRTVTAADVETDVAHTGLAVTTVQPGVVLVRQPTGCA